MTIEEIGNKLKTRYNWEGKGQLQIDIKEQLKQYSQHDLDRIWFKFDTTYMAAWPPKPAHFYGIASDLGIAKNKQSGKFQGAWECDCGAMYSMKSSNCPMCQSGNTVRVVDAVTPGVIECQHDCYHCDVFNGENCLGIFGPACKPFAVGENIPNCSDCRCKDCCKYEHDFREDERNNTFFTEGRQMPWIGEAGKGVTQRVNFESLMTAVKAKATKQRAEDLETLGYKRGYKMTWETWKENEKRNIEINGKSRR